MIPSTWCRSSIVLVVVLGFAAALLWTAASLSSTPAERTFGQTAAGIAFLVAFYAGAPLTARFLASEPARDTAMQQRLSTVVAALALPSRPVFLYDHREGNAITVGLVPGHSRVYLTTGFLRELSDTGLGGVLAHEDAHLCEYHVLVTLGYACAYSLLAHLIQDGAFSFAGFLGFTALRRVLEYRADAGAARRVGSAAVITWLQESEKASPSGRWQRLTTFVALHPTVPMRVRALETGRRRLF